MSRGLMKKVSLCSHLAASVLAAAMLAAMPMVYAADGEENENRAELRIENMRRMLTIQPAQEAQWKIVATIMRDNAVTMDALTQLRVDHVEDFSAVDDLTSYGDISAAHADGIRKLTPAFRTLYEAMSVAQKDQADLLFRKGEHPEATIKTSVTE